MKIISGPKKWSMEISCNHCETLLEIEAEDVKAGYRHGAYCEQGEWTYFVICPVCEEEIECDFSILPKVAKRYADSKFKK